MTTMSSSILSASSSAAPGQQQAAHPKWPNGAKAAISFTMDNLGEAQDVRTGTWPADKPYGTHPAILETLPRILSLLDGTTTTTTTTTTTKDDKQQQEQPIKATYFAESWSLPIYPAAVAALHSRGHEIAWHGYQHEVWSTLSPEAETAVFAQSFSLAREHGITYRGFRPPGGTINGAQTTRLLQRYGVHYVSPLGAFGVHPLESGEEEQQQDSNNNNNKTLVTLPFEWKTVDAFWYMDKFAPIRKQHGEQEAPLGPAAFKAYLFRKFDDVVREGGYISILFHPFLTTSEDKFDVIKDVVHRLRRDPDIWVAPCHEVAEWAAEHHDARGTL